MKIGITKSDLTNHLFLFCFEFCKVHRIQKKTCKYFTIFYARFNKLPQNDCIEVYTAYKENFFLSQYKIS